MCGLIIPERKRHSKEREKASNGKTKIHDDSTPHQLQP